MKAITAAKRATPSIKADTTIMLMNSLFITSGGRAIASIALPPILPIPIPAPIAAKPAPRPAPNCARPLVTNNYDIIVVIF